MTDFPRNRRQKTALSVLMLALAAVPIPAAAQIHDHRDTGFGVDHAMLASLIPPAAQCLQSRHENSRSCSGTPVSLAALSLRNGAGAVTSLSWNAERRAASHAIALPDLAPGTYWATFHRRLGAIMPGVIHFPVS